MDFRAPATLGRTGLTVSRLGLSASYGVPARAVERAYHEHGINLFYWGSIRRIRFARALRHLARTERDKMVIMLQSYDRTGKLLPLFFQRGLDSLKLDHADILLLGWYNQYPPARIIDAALALKERGKVRFLAVSGHHRPFFGDLARKHDQPFDLFMVRYNAAHRGAEQDVFPFLHGEDRPGIITYTATRWGQLLKARKMPKDERPLTASDCYRFALSNPNVDACMTGPANERQWQEALPTLDAGPLSEAEMARIRRIGDHVHG